MNSLSTLYPIQIQYKHVLNRKTKTQYTLFRIHRNIHRRGILNFRSLKIPYANKK